MNKDSAGGMGIGFLIGAVVGLAVGFLFSPHSGKENREIIKEKAQSLIDKVKHKKEMEEV